MESIKNQEEFVKIISSKNLTVVHFCADWVEQCKDVNGILAELSKLPTVKKVNVKFFQILAEEVADVSLKYKIDAVPTVLFFRNSQLIDRVDGVNPEKLNNKLEEHLGLKDAQLVDEIKGKKDLNEHLKELINRHKVMIFMKGDRDQPRCGFSKQLIQIINNIGIDYGTFDILTDEEVRQGLKTYSDWPTYPQVYVKGELIGGLDIIKEMEQSGELVSTLKQ